jgi:hypothetical protein
MREIVDADRLFRFMRALGEEATVEGRVYLTGGATAVLLGWRLSTIDVDIKLVPEHSSVTRAIPRLKETLHVNVELAAPDQFIPPLPGWEERSRFIERHGRASFFHYDFYAQALAKIERGHAQDLEDVRQMIGLGLVETRKALDLFSAIEPELHRYPAIDPASFRKEAERALGQKS